MDRQPGEPSHAATAQRQAAIKEALTGYLRRNNRLPCPDTDFTAPDGVENRTTTGDLRRPARQPSRFSLTPWVLRATRPATVGVTSSYHVSNTNITAMPNGNWSANPMGRARLVPHW